MGDVDEEAHLAGGEALRSYPKDPSEQVGEDWASARGHFGPPDLRTQGDCLSKTSSVIHSCLDVAAVPSLDWESGNAGSPAGSDLACGALQVSHFTSPCLPFPSLLCLPG